MRRAALLALAAAACDLPAVGLATRASLTGSPDTDHPEVCAIKVTAPPDDMGNQAVYYCSGTLIEAQTVLTDARCVYENVQKDMTDAIEVQFGTSFVDGDTTLAVDAVEVYRYFDSTVAGRDEPALIHLATSPGITPATLNLEPLDAGNVGDALTLVGFGRTESGHQDPDLRNAITTPITQVGPVTLEAGTTDVTTCGGDLGGPGYDDLGDGPVMVSITFAATPMMPQSSCTSSVSRGRIDVIARDLLIPYIDRVSGPCKVDGACVTDCGTLAAGCADSGCGTPDPDCAGNECEWSGNPDTGCAEDCPAGRDWDCPVGSFAGQACDQTGDCEQHGECVPAPDDETFTYCTLPCDPTGPESCPSGMLCTDQGGGDTQCVFDPSQPSPGSQGATCILPTDCRSNVCEDSICVYPCGPGDSCPDPYTCGPSTVADGTKVCLSANRAGGGGFCAVGGDAAGSLVPLGLALAALLVRSSRRRSAARAGNGAAPGRPDRSRPGRG